MSVRLVVDAINQPERLLRPSFPQASSITLAPAHREFTTVEAANFLNVSRPFVIKEIEAGRLEHSIVGTHRRIAFEDVIAYACRCAKSKRLRWTSWRQTSTNWGWIIN